MRSVPVRIVSLLLGLFTIASGQQAFKEKPVVKKLTPVIIVEEIEPCLPFWIERLGFQKTVEVPEGDKLGFVTLVKGGVEIMYQTRLSVAKDLKITADQKVHALSGAINPTTDKVALYIEVEKLDLVIANLKGVEVIVPERTTFYGAREFGVREPGGTVVTFAEFAKKD
jgi:uncharacterized glyoxalase superfamily protein PhnB